MSVIGKRSGKELIYFRVDLSARLLWPWERTTEKKELNFLFHRRTIGSFQNN